MRMIKAMIDDNIEQFGPFEELNILEQSSTISNLERLIKIDIMLHFALFTFIIIGILYFNSLLDKQITNKRNIEKTKSYHKFDV